MPLYASSLYNSAGVRGGDVLVPVYDPLLNADKIMGGWTLPDVQQIISEVNPPPTPQSIADIGKAIAEKNLIAPDDVQKLNNLMTEYQVDAKNPEEVAVVYYIIGLNFLYDTFRLLSLEEIGKKKYNLDRRQMMLARNRAALLTRHMVNVLQKMNDPKWEELAKKIFAIFHIKRGVTRAEMLAEMAEDGYYTGVNEGLLPRIDERGFGSGKNITPWTTDWNKLSPELAARAVHLLNKTTKHGIALDPDTLAKAAEGYVPPELIEEANRIMEEESKQKKKTKTKKKSPSKAAAAPVKAKRAGKKRRTKTYDDGIVYPVFSDDEEDDYDDDEDDDIVYPSSSSSKKTKSKGSKKSQAPKKGSREAKLRMAKVRAAKGKKGKRKTKGGSAIWDNYFNKVFHYDKRASPFSTYKNDFTPGLIWRRA